MQIISDLHVHSKHSRGCSTNLDIKNLEKYARIKGLDLLGTGDFTHPKWIKELKKLTEEDGILKTESGFPFLCQTELSLIYTQDGRGHRIHNVVLAPNLEVVEQITDELLKRGRVDYDGRPIFKIPCPEFVEMLQQISKDVEVIPAHCLIPNSLIHAQNSIKKIKDLTKKDYVLTHKGRFKKVKKIFKRKYSGEIIEILPTCLKKGSYFTPEHPIYSIKTHKSCKNVPHTICKPTCAYLKRGCKIKAFKDYKPSWHQVKELEKGDIVLYPRYNAVKDKSTIYLKDFVKGFKEGDYIKPRNSKQSIKNTLIKNKIKISKNFCRLLGYYLAEGYCTRDYVGFTFSEKEIEYIEDVKNLLKQAFGKFIKIQTKKEVSRGTSIIVHSKILKEFFSIFYNEKPFKSFNKCLPYWFIDLPAEKLKELLKGWWRGDAGYTSSINMINQFKIILLKLGAIPSIDITSAESINKRRKSKNNSIKGRKITAKHDIFHIHNISFFKNCSGIDKIPEFKRFIAKLDRRKGWIDNNYIYLPISKLNKKKYSGLVYNLEVKDDNSYLTENLAVHNCWTPWFSMFGENSGFNTVKDCFQDKTNKIHAVETGMSSDPAMNWRISQLDKFNLVSFSDLHSFWPWRIGREATEFDVKKLTYKNILNAIRGSGITKTIEVDPGYGKYHLTGHRKCNVCLEPKESLKLQDICPVCKRKLTVGVLERVEELADRPEGYFDKNRPGFLTLIPLSEIISKLYGFGVATKKVWGIYNQLIDNFKSELNIMLNVSKEDLIKVVDERLAEEIINNREGKIKVKAGYDGVYGEPVFKDKITKKQKNLGGFS